MISLSSINKDIAKTDIDESFQNSSLESSERSIESGDERVENVDCVDIGVDSKVEHTVLFAANGCINIAVD